MKVPTYEAQLQRPRQGQGQFLTAQISASAMAAPARAYAESGQQLAQAGAELAAFGFKKAQVGADNEAQAAAAKLDIELQQMQQDFLANPNMQQAEQKYQDMARRKVETFKSGLSNRLARDAFRSRAAQITLRNQINFSKSNNARVVERRTVLLDTDTNDALIYATNPSNSPESRAEVANLALLNIDNALRDLGPEEHAKRRQKFYADLAKGSLISAINKGADAEETLEGFRTNKSADPVVSAARQNLAPGDVDKIYGEVKTSTDRTRQYAERKQKVQRESIALDFDDQLKSMVNDLEVNADMADVDVATKFTEDTTQMINDAVESHDGSAESKAELSIQLRKLRSKQMINIGELQQTARRKDALRKVGGDVRALVTDVTRDPGQLSAALQTLDLSINESAARFINTEEEENARQAGREDLFEAVLNTHLAKGDVNAARELFNSPGVAQALTPSLQEDYKEKFRDYDNKQNKFTREYREKVNLYRQEFGVEPDARMKRQMMGAGDSQQAFQQAKGLRDAFEKGSSRYRLLEENFGKVKASAENVSPAGDVSLIFAYMKMIDPGSVVRESEFATAQNTGSIPQRLWARYNAALEGERLTKEQRADFKNSAEKLFESQKPLQRDLQERYKKLATMFGLPVEQVVYDLVDKKPVVSAPVVQPGEQPTPAGAAQPAGPVSPPATAPSAADTTPPPIRIDASGKVIQ
jgi:hypothetical protein